MQVFWGFFVCFFCDLEPMLSSDLTYFQRTLESLSIMPFSASAEDVYMARLGKIPAVLSSF